MPFFSVIIPIYRVEKYLKRCVDSVLAQEFKDFEVILVDDGSPDGCGEICDAYQKKDNRVRVIHKENGGLSSARNAGIRIASGNYLMFLDSDDYWDGVTGLQEIHEYLCNKPVDYLRMCAYDESAVTRERRIVGRGYNKEIFKCPDIQQVIDGIFRNGYPPGAVWVAIIKREVVLENNLFFPEGIKSEDIDWTIHVMLHIKSMAYSDHCFYVYTYGRSDSITGTINLKSITDILWIIDRWNPVLKKDAYKTMSQSLNTYLAYHLLCAIIIYDQLAPEDKKVAKREIAKRKHILYHVNRKKVSVAAWVYKVFGTALSSKIMNLYHRRRADF